jgi:hypothetical protein
VVLILVTTYSKVQKILGFKTLISSNQNDSIVKKPNVLITGVIKDRKSKKGIPNAYITSDIKLKDTVVTTSDGTFQFEASGDVGQSIRLYVQATGYQPRNEYRSFGLPIEIELDKR